MRKIVAVLKLLNSYPSGSLIMKHLYWIFLVKNTHLGIPTDLFMDDCEKMFHKADN